ALANPAVLAVPVTDSVLHMVAVALLKSFHHLPADRRTIVRMDQLFKAGCTVVKQIVDVIPGKIQTTCTDELHCPMFIDTCAVDQSWKGVNELFGGTDKVGAFRVVIHDASRGWGRRHCILQPFLLPYADCGADAYGAIKHEESIQESTLHSTQ